MKNTTRRTYSVIFAVVLLTSFALGCAAVKREFNSPDGTTNAPPIVSQIAAVSPIVAVAVPFPWSAAALAVLGTISAAASAYAASKSQKATANAPAAWNSLPPKI